MPRLIDSAPVREHIEALLRREVLSAAPGKITSSFIGLAHGLLRVVRVGVGDADYDDESLRFAIAAAIHAVPAAEAVVICAAADTSGAVRAVCEGALLGAYDFGLAPALPTERLITVFTAAPDSYDIRSCAESARIISDAVMVARDLGNMPPSELTPGAFAEHVLRETADCPLAITVFDEEHLREHSFGGIVGVGQGSSNPPRLVKVEYAPAGAQRHIALVGKGITFDSGGLGLKNRAGMLWMKCDMGGAAAVYAAILAISRMAVPVRVTGWLALAENMPSGTAVKPSDVLRMRNGSTVEVTDTDAEGRLVMADALAAACEEDPDFVADVATLTGAQIIALGNRTSAVMARRDTAAADVLTAADDCGEAMWRLPMPDHLREHLISQVADLANMGGTDASVIVGAHFLEHFVTAGTPWVHVDIAGPAINTEARYGYTSHGATGAGVRTLVQLAVNSVA